MPILHKVREHLRSGSDVREYERGEGQRVAPASGTFQGTTTAAAMEKTPQGLRAKIEARLEQIRDQRKLDNEERQLARDEYEYKVAGEKALARSEQIRKEEEIRAREGGFFTRTFKGAVRSGVSELRKSESKPRRSRTGTSRKTKLSKERRAPKAKHKKRKSEDYDFAFGLFGG